MLEINSMDVKAIQDANTQEIQRNKNEKTDIDFTANKFTICHKWIILPFKKRASQNIQRPPNYYIL